MNSANNSSSYTLSECPRCHAWGCPCNDCDGDGFIAACESCGETSVGGDRDAFIDTCTVNGDCGCGKGAE